MPHRTTEGSKTAVSTHATASGRGVFRGAFVARGALGRAKGAGARSAMRARVAVSIAATALTLLLAVFVTPALAVTGHRYVGQFGGFGSTSGAFSSPAGVAVQQSTGDVYVADQGNGRVEKFTAGGEFILAFNGPVAGSFSPAAVAVSPSSGDVCVADQANNAVDIFSSTGAYISQLDATATPAGAFSSPSGVAVDPSNGDVYVADSGNVVIDVFSSTGVYLTQFGSGTLAYPTGVAVDGDSNVYVADAGYASLFKYPALGAGAPTVIDTNGVQAVGVNPVSDEVYVGENGPSGYQVADYNPAGGRVYTFGSGRIGASVGIAVKGSTDEVYVADQANSDVLQFASFVAPTVSTGGATAVSASSESVAGVVNPEGVQASYRFEYGTEESYGGSGPEEEAGAGSADVPASSLLEGLEPNTTYHYRLSASNTLGSNFGEDETFTTSPTPPVVDGQAPFASAITATTATLHGTVDPRNSPSTYHFNYGTSTAYTSTAPNPDAQGGAAGEEQVSTTISGLAPSTTYHFQVVADNGTGGPVAGEDGTFTTLPPVPAASTGSAAGITESTAVLSGSADTAGLSGSYQFLVTGTDTPGGGETSPQPLSAVNGGVPVSATIAGLSPSAHYTYRLAVTTAGGTVYGAEQPLATTAVPAYQPLGVQGASGPLSAGLATPITQTPLLTAPAPQAAAPKPVTKPKPKKKPKKKKKKQQKRKRKPAAKKANVNEKGHR